MKALIVTRLSRLVDESSSAERQQQDCREVCERHGWEVIGVAEDLNVSAGKTSPFQRPELGRWLGDGVSNPGRMHEIDVIVFWRLDRLVRSVTQLAEMISWAERFGVTLKSATESHFDLSSSMGKVIASMVASFAEMELEAIRERITADQQHRVRSGLYRGGKMPFGYRVEPRSDGTGKQLVPDPEQGKIVRRLVEGILAGKSANQLAFELNGEGIPCSADLTAIREGKKPTGGSWHGGHIKRLLLSPALRGLVETSDPLLDQNGRPVIKNGRKQYGKRYVLRNEDGTPVQRAEPLISSDEYAKLRKILDDRAVGQRPNRATVSLLTGVLFCGSCGSVTYRMKGGKGRRVRYRCDSARRPEVECHNPVLTVDFEWANNAVETQLLSLMEGSMKRRRVWDPGTDTLEEQTALQESLDGMIDKIGTPPFLIGTSAYESLERKIEALSVKIDELKKTKGIPAGWKWEETGETFADWWHRISLQEKNQFLKNSEVRATFLHSEDRKKDEVPLLNVEFNFEALNGDHTEGSGVTKYKDLLAQLPAGQTLHLGDGDPQLKPR